MILRASCLRHISWRVEELSTEVALSGENSVTCGCSISTPHIPEFNMEDLDMWLALLDLRSYAFHKRLDPLAQHFMYYMKTLSRYADAPPDVFAREWTEYSAIAWSQGNAV